MRGGPPRRAVRGSAGLRCWEVGRQKHSDRFRQEAARWLPPRAWHWQVDVHRLLLPVVEGP